MNESTFVPFDPDFDPLELLARELRDGCDGPLTPARIEQRLREIVARDGDVSCDAFCREIGCSYPTIRSRFGSWKNLRKLVGLSVAKPREPTHDEVTAETIRAAFARLFAEEGEALTLRRFVERTGYGVQLVNSRVGGWRRLRREHGLGGRARTSDAALLRALAPLVRRLRRFPTTTETRRHGRYDPSLYVQRFGSWKATRRAYRRLVEVPGTRSLAGGTDVD